MDLNSSATEFATIDELLDGDEEEEEEDDGDTIPIPEPAVQPNDVLDSIPVGPAEDRKRVTADEHKDIEPEIAEVSQVDVKECPEPDMITEDALVDEITAEEVKQVISYPPLEAAKMNIFSSSLLDDVIRQKELQGAATIPPNSAMEGQLNELFVC
jgi:hypothetical protein